MLRCPVCRQAIRSADANLERMVAKCAPCDFVFQMEPEMVTPDDGTPPTLPATITHTNERPSAARAGYRTGGGPAVSPVTLTRRWRDKGAMFMVAWCVIWDLSMIAALYQALATGAWQSLGFMFAHIAIGVASTYYTAALLFNRTRVQLDSEALTVVHTPIWWRGGTSVPSAGVTGFTWLPGTIKLNNVRMFDVIAQTDGDGVRLVKNIPAEEARYLAWALGEALGPRSQPTSR